MIPLKRLRSMKESPTVRKEIFDTRQGAFSSKEGSIYTIEKGLSVTKKNTPASAEAPLYLWEEASMYSTKNEPWGRPRKDFCKAIIFALTGYLIVMS